MNCIVGTLYWIVSLVNLLLQQNCITKKIYYYFRLGMQRWWPWMRVGWPVIVEPGILPTLCLSILWNQNVTWKMSVFHPRPLILHKWKVCLNWNIIILNQFIIFCGIAQRIYYCTVSANRKHMLSKSPGIHCLHIYHLISQYLSIKVAASREIFS